MDVDARGIVFCAGGKPDLILCKVERSPARAVGSGVLLPQSEALGGGRGAAHIGLKP